MSESETIHRYVTLKQVESMRDAAHAREQRYDTSLRDEVIITVAADLGLRVGELVQLKQAMFHLDEEEVMLPGPLQKDYPVEDQSPSSATLRLDPYGEFGTVRLLRTYFKTIDDTKWVFPSREGDSHITEETVRNVVEDLAVEADINIRRTDGELAEPSEAHPHMLRHSLSNYMLKDSDTRLIDVRNRLRHRSIQTTEQVYEHFQRR